MGDMTSSPAEPTGAIRQRSKTDTRGFWTSLGVVAAGFGLAFVGRDGPLSRIGGVVILVGMVPLLVFGVRRRIDQWRFMRLQRADDLNRAHEQRDKFI